MDPNTNAEAGSLVEGTTVGVHAGAYPSSTGTPWIPPAIVPYLIMLAVFAGAIENAFPPDHVVAKVCHALVTASAVLGMASPGLRRRS